MKKRICSIVLAVLMLVCFTIPAFAADVSNTTIIDCGDGYYLKVTLTEYVPEAATRAIYQKTATSKADAYHGNTYIGTFYLNGTFQYDTVTSKATADSCPASSSYGLFRRFVAVGEQSIRLLHFQLCRREKTHYVYNL